MNYIVVADDLTGANATCSLLKKLGLKTFTLIKDDVIVKELSNIDAIAFSTDSRAIEKNIAYNRVFKIVNAQKNDNILLYNKRIDSTMRGNIGVEILAMLDAINDPSKIAVVVPAYPNSGRVVLNQTMLVNGRLLKNSDAGKDTKTPIFTSNVKDIIQNGIDEKIEFISLETISENMEKLKEVILEKTKNSRILLFDAVVNEDIIKIVRAIVSLNLNIITVDPGPFTMYYAKELQKKYNRNKKILMVVGSATKTTKLQLENILQQEDILLIKMNPELFFNEQKRKNEIENVYNQINIGIKSHDIILITTTPLGNTKKLDLPKIAEEHNLSIDEISKIISNTLTEVATNVLQNNSFEGVYCSGGDITLSLIETLGGLGIEIKDEIIPLATYGKVLGGIQNQLKIVSKGGMVGDINTVKLCLNKIQNDI